LARDREWFLHTYYGFLTATGDRPVRLVKAVGRCRCAAIVDHGLSFCALSFVVRHMQIRPTFHLAGSVETSDRGAQLQSPAVGTAISGCSLIPVSRSQTAGFLHRFVLLLSFPVTLTSDRPGLVMEPGGKWKLAVGRPKSVGRQTSRVATSTPP